ncbi:alpha-ketoacid dehydrogenase subunit alpha/beta [Bacteroidetes bacterium endosymbiont of Geopemphigus sp.]|uniref:alpha-ketoacid dehydrogenase subunit alpha/beta n=1 Tax=Bacteroidetes bacterium endosymbiont of Geopemphigus sp. TaxID=2047937 RepID=UPI000CD2EE33|nr:alpha-ketoacid dehydrogenase subunit alpha/beta [Bacteroidetes bacterium endosymbiont of Geopemphigus sp.]
MQPELQTDKNLSFEEFRQSVLADYRLACTSREISLLGRKEVLTGKSKFGIFGDGKELPQLAMARVFKEGDFRSGYYRDQTFMIAIGALGVKQFFAQLYAHADPKAEPSSSSRMMTNHLGMPLLDENGHWLMLSKQKNSASDLSPVASQIPRLLGLAQASKIYKDSPSLKSYSERFSNGGNEIVFGTIGNASTSEGLFWETFNAAGVLQVPVIISVWDDDYGISVPGKYHTTKKSLSQMLSGFQRANSERGFEIFSVKGWDYTELIETYARAEKIAREEHVPVLVHVTELTQPQGHSTSGSHERYKSSERLEWERTYDCLKKFRQWILDFELTDDQQPFQLTTSEVLDQIEEDAKKYVRQEQKAAWDAFQGSLVSSKNEALDLMVNLYESVSDDQDKNTLAKLLEDVKSKQELSKRNVFSAVRKSLYLVSSVSAEKKSSLAQWYRENMEKERENYSSHLYSCSDLSVLTVQEVIPTYSDESLEVDARIILRDNFDRLLDKNPQLLIFGQDAGKIGDVNQGLEGLQGKYGEMRVGDTGIREASMIGQGIGLAMRGLRPIVEIQYLDYILYALQLMSDDIATMQYRTRGAQKVPVIVRTRGHRLEGMWHSGSLMGGLIHFLRGMLLLVPRDMTKAAGFYNTLMETDEPALVIECLNAYRLKEKMPENLGEFRTPVGQIERTRSGKDVTLVSYGSTWRIVMVAADELAQKGIEAEVVDVQSLIPFDLSHDIVKSLEKNHRLVIIDEDVPGGASAYILQKILQEQNGYYQLDSQPITITAQEHRPAYGSDGDYFSKPSVEDVVEGVYALMHESDPQKYPLIY